MSFQRAITDRFSVNAAWEGPAIDSLERCAEQDCTVEVMDTTCNARVARLQGSVAARFVCLMTFLQNRTAYTGDFNCFSALRFLLGKTNALEWDYCMKIQGPKLYVHDAAQQLGFPFVFQICGDGPFTRTRKADHWQQGHGVIHAGLVIGKDAGQEPLILEKDCHRQLLISTWKNVADRYFHRMADDMNPRYVTCFPIEEFNDAES